MQANKLTRFDLHKHYLAIRRRMNANAVIVTEVMRSVQIPKEEAPKPEPIRVNAHKVIITSPSVREIVFITSRIMNVTPWDIMGKRRDRNVIDARHMAIYCAREVTNFSYPQLGRAFGGLDHSTVIHAARRISEIIKESHEMRAIAEAVIEEFNDDSL